MRLILTHENADFDAVASLLAAAKLHPSATPLLPRRVNRNVDQFLTLYWDAFQFTRPSDWVQACMQADLSHTSILRFT
jgi:tRNA nucleotidyltransferase (CCA-adding enzyme)